MDSFTEFSVLLFLSLIVVVYVLAIGIVIRWLLQKLKLFTPSRTFVPKWLRRLILSLSAIGIMCIAYGYFVEPYWLSVSHIKITSSKLPPGSKPVRIVHISDLHSDPRPRLEGRLAQAIAAEHPDIIVFTGDSINVPAGLPVFRNCLTEVAKIAPTFAVKGNWDAWYWRNLELFAGTGAHELNGTSAMVNVNGLPIWIVGVGVENEKSLEQAVASAPPDAFKIFLYHYPDLIKEAAALKVDLYCAGHTHGGQVALPLYGALITFSKYGKRYESGLYREGETWMYVNRGIGMEGGSAPRVRFWARPEVTVIEVSGN
jgi:predicted MPP superfamily phosphohydrolase